MFLTARRLFDGRTPEPFDNWMIEIDDGQIVDIGPRRTNLDADDVVDLGDATLLPGLIDIHQHLGFDASVDPVAQLTADNDATLLLRMRLAAQRALAVGITTIRDLGDRGYTSLTLRDWFAAGHEVGPRILASGPPITTTGGHCWFLGGEADGPDAVRQAVRDRVARGVDVIKIMASGGNMTPTVGPHQSQYGTAELAAAADEAHAHGLKLAVHAHGTQSIVDALAAGVDSIEHCTFFTADGVDAAPDILDALAHSTTTISMTAAVLPAVEAPYPAIRQRLAAIFENHTILRRDGARVVCSSDAGVGPNKPHDVLPYGVSTFLPRIGMTNAEALTATTSAAADACGIGHLTGSLEPGKAADILAVSGNPLDDITAIHNIAAVYTRGAKAPHRRATPPTTLEPDDHRPQRHQPGTGR